MLLCEIRQSCRTIRTSDDHPKFSGTLLLKSENFRLILRILDILSLTKHKIVAIHHESSHVLLARRRPRNSNSNLQICEQRGISTGSSHRRLGKFLGKMMKKWKIMMNIPLFDSGSPVHHSFWFSSHRIVERNVPLLMSKPLYPMLNIEKPWKHRGFLQEDHLHKVDSSDLRERLPQALLERSIRIVNLYES